MNTQMKTIVFVSFENEFAPLGGLAAVMRLLPKHMAGMSDDRCVTVTPFFREITKCKPKLMDSIQSTGLTFSLVYDGKKHQVEIFRHQSGEGFTTYLIDTQGFFNAPCDCGDPPGMEAPCNPYLNPAHPEQILDDSLLFSSAVPKTLVALGLTQNVVLCLQDWEAAGAAIVAKNDPRLSGISCLLTLHNSYDRPVSQAEMKRMTDLVLPGPTVLAKAGPFLDGPICTVSKHFAHELIHEPVHRDIFAPHLQEMFKKRTIRGINNGLFSQLDFSPEARTQASSGSYDGLLEEKARRRREMIEKLEAYQPERAWGSLDFGNFDGPVLLFFGRDDPRQKGYDLAAAAIDRIPPGQAKFVFTPIPGDEGIQGLQFLQNLATRRPGEVKVFPFRMEQGYMELQRGASFMVMCSLYEPFGGATEGYAVGTPVVARATGGLVQQVVPYPSVALNAAVRSLSDQFHRESDAPTGFLFHESGLGVKETAQGWSAILDCAYWPESDRLTERLGIPLFQSMVQATECALKNAIELYQTDQAGYAQMINHGFHMLDRFSWDQAVREYQEIFSSFPSP
jgi:glycogen synthase